MLLLPPPPLRPQHKSLNMSNILTDRIRGHAAPCAAQMSHASVFDGRGRSRGAARRAHVRRGGGADFARRWSLLMIASFPSREACAVHFGVTFQTACNWFDGHCRPYGDAVAHAVETLPRYGEVMRG